MDLKSILDRKAKAITDAREIAASDEYAAGDTVAEESYQRAVSDARRFGQLAVDETERQTMDAELDEARAKLEAVIHPSGVAAPAAVDPLIRDIHEFCAEPRDDMPAKRHLNIPWSPRAMEERWGKRANEEWWMGGATPYASYTATSRLMTDIIGHENAESGVLAAGPSFIDTADGNTLYWPMLATDATAALTAERVAATLTYPVFSKPQLDSYRIDGYMVITHEMIRDSAVNIMAAVSEVASRALATKVAYYLSTGTGTTMPDGLPTKAATGVTAAAKTTFTANELIDLYLSVLPGSRARGSWIAGSSAIAIILKLQSDDGQYYLHDISTQSGLGTIMGKNLYEDAGYPACTTGLKPVTFGDVSAYKVRRIGGVAIERDDSVYFTQYESVVRFSLYMDADLFDTTTNKCLLLA